MTTRLFHTQLTCADKGFSHGYNHTWYGPRGRPLTPDKGHQLVGLIHHQLKGRTDNCWSCGRNQTRNGSRGGPSTKEIHHTTWCGRQNYIWGRELFNKLTILSLGNLPPQPKVSLPSLRTPAPYSSTTRSWMRLCIHQRNELTFLSEQSTMCIARGKSRCERHRDVFLLNSGLVCWLETQKTRATCEVCCINVENGQRFSLTQMQKLKGTFQNFERISQ